MLKLNKFDAAGKQAGEIEVNDSVFAAPIKKQAVHEALLRQLSNKRCAHAKTRGRSDLSGGSAKPWRQKGTGRARIGSLRSPLRRGGAVTFGPDGRDNFKMRLPRKVRRAALRSLLTAAVKDGRLAIIDDLRYEVPKTKNAISLLGQLEFDGQKVLFVIPERNENFEKSVRNIPKVKAILWSNLNPHDLLNFEQILMFEGAIAKVVEVLQR